MKDISVIIVAAGESKRLKTKVRKPYLILKGKSILLHSLDVFRKIPAVGEIVIAINPKDSERANKIIAPIQPEADLPMAQVACGDSEATLLTRPWRGSKKKTASDNHKPVHIKTVIGGAFRAESVLNALKSISNQSKIVLIHDAARPFVKQSDVIKLIKEIRRTGSAILAIPVTDTIKKTGTRPPDRKSSRAGKNRIIIEKTITPRQSLWAAQTPQGFKKDILIKAYNLSYGISKMKSQQPLTLRVKGLDSVRQFSAIRPSPFGKKGCPKEVADPDYRGRPNWYKKSLGEITDDASLVERLGLPVSIIKGSAENIKITTKADIL